MNTRCMLRVSLESEKCKPCGGEVHAMKSHQHSALGIQGGSVVAVDGESFRLGMIPVGLFSRRIPGMTFKFSNGRIGPDPG